jgi:HPt (histidine-containing phosphotransfer) domain-containing protein
MLEHPSEVLDAARLATLEEDIGDADLVRETVRMFLDELPERLATLRAAVAGGDADLMRGAAHALGSPAAMLGATGIASATRTIERSATSTDAVDHDELLGVVEREAIDAEAAMLDYLGVPLSS